MQLEAFPESLETWKDLNLPSFNDRFAGGLVSPKPLLCTSWNPKQPFFLWMFGETTISQVKVWNHQTETTILKWMFQVPGLYLRMACLLFGTLIFSSLSIDLFHLYISSSNFKWFSVFFGSNFHTPNHPTVDFAIKNLPVANATEISQRFPVPSACGTCSCEGTSPLNC